MKNSPLLLAGLIGLCAIAAACSRPPARSRTEPAVALLGTNRTATTARDDLAKTIARSRARLAAVPGDPAASVTLADALLRQTRVAGNAGLAREAEQVLGTVVASDPERYDALRMLAATYLSEHRFADALKIAERCRALRQDDAWVYGVIGDAHVERGEYDAAFDAFDRMAAIKPTAAAYARASYARELQGDLEAAVRFMQMAADATSAHDPESLAWHHAQLGHLQLDSGRLDAAQREFAYAGYVFPGHPFAAAGLARVAAARGDYRTALSLLQPVIRETPSPADVAFVGDLHAALGDHEAAERHYRLAEAAWTADAPEPSRLARFLAEHGRSLDRAVAAGQQARIDRNDIFTADALAWAYFQQGELAEAAKFMTLALRTGSRDRLIRYHAAAIARARGDLDQARTYARQAVAGLPRFDPIAGPAATALAASLEAPQVARR